MICGSFFVSAQVIQMAIYWEESNLSILLVKNIYIDPDDYFNVKPLSLMSVPIDNWRVSKNSYLKALAKLASLIFRLMSLFACNLQVINLGPFSLQTWHDLNGHQKAPHYISWCP